MTTPIYYSFKEFQENYNSDFEEWKKIYPDGTERFFLEEIEIDYQDYCIQKDGIWVFDDSIEVEYIPEPGRYSTVHFGLPNYVDLINRIYHNYLTNENIIPKDLSDYELGLISSLEDVFSDYSEDFCYADGDVFVRYLPFMKFEKEILPLHSPYYFEINADEDKFKNFGFSCIQIIEWIEQRKRELSKIKGIAVNHSIGIEHETNDQSNEIKFRGTHTEFIELVKALIENGNLKGTQKEIIENLSKFFQIEIKNPDKII